MGICQHVLYVHDAKTSLEANFQLDLLTKNDHEVLCENLGRGMCDKIFLYMGWVGCLGMG